MNKKQLIARVRRYMGPGATGSAASAAVEAVLSSLVQEAEATPVRVPGLGTFEVKDVPEHTGYSPAEGGPTTYPASRKLTFRAASGLQKLIKKPRVRTHSTF